MTDIPADPANGEERVRFFTKDGATIFMNAAGELGIDIGGEVIIKRVKEAAGAAGALKDSVNHAGLQ